MLYLRYWEAAEFVWSLTVVVSVYAGSARRFSVQHLLRSRQIGDISALSSSVLQVGLIISSCNDDDYDD